MSDTARLAAILQPGRILSERDVLAILEIRPSLAVARRHRLELRDAEIQRAARLMGQPTESRQARALALVYARYLSTAWPRERDLEHLPHPAAPLRSMLHRIAFLNRGDPMGRTQLYKVICGVGRD